MFSVGRQAQAAEEDLHKLEVDSPSNDLMNAVSLPSTLNDVNSGARRRKRPNLSQIRYQNEDIAVSSAPTTLASTRCLNDDVAYGRRKM